MNNGRDLESATDALIISSTYERRSWSSSWRLRWWPNISRRTRTIKKCISGASCGSRMRHCLVNVAQRTLLNRNAIRMSLQVLSSLGFLHRRACNDQSDSLAKWAPSGVRKVLIRRILWSFKLRVSYRRIRSNLHCDWLMSVESVNKHLLRRTSFMQNSAQMADRLQLDRWTQRPTQTPINWASQQ